MNANQIVSQEEWLKARKVLLAREKEFTRARDALSRARRELPWVKVTKSYIFDSARGAQSLGDLFEGKGQLIVYHFMFHPDWTEGCKGCSFWADNFNGIVVHLKHRDANLVAVSRAPYEKLEAYKKRMGWTFNWVSSATNDFNFDFRVSFTPAELKTKESIYNFNTMPFELEEAPGVTVFLKNEAGEIFRTYSTYARGLDMINGAYHCLDLLPKGRDEEGLPVTMAWLRRHDEYED